MSKIYYAPSHEYVMVDGNIGHVGISDYAQKALGNIVYVDMPEVGEEFSEGPAGEEFGAVESVKAAEDLLSPVSGAVLNINEALIDNPRLLNEDPMGNWIMEVEMTDLSELEGLMDEAAYAAYCESETH